MTDTELQYERLEQAIKASEETPKPIRFHVGDKVRITTEIFLKKPTVGVIGFVEKINGGYIYVRPKYHKHWVECYACELEHV